MGQKKRAQLRRQLASARKQLRIALRAALAYKNKLADAEREASKGRLVVLWAKDGDSSLEVLFDARVTGLQMDANAPEPIEVTSMFSPGAYRQYIPGRGPKKITIRYY